MAIFRQVLALLFLAIAVSTAYGGDSLSTNEYWTMMAQRTEFPQALRAVVHAPTGMAKGNVNHHRGHGGLGEINYSSEHAGTTIPAGEKKGPTTQTQGHPNLGVGKGNVPAVNHHHGSSGGLGDINYSSRHDRTILKKNETPVTHHPSVDIFFLEKDMQLGRKMNLKSFKTDDEATFLPRHVANSIPFSSNNFPEILERFNLTSDDAEAMKKTIKDCEAKGIKSEKKLCATSLEAMIDFSLLNLGRNVEARSTHVQEIGEQPSPKEYSIVRVSERITNDRATIVACHKVEYAYAVFYCHMTAKTVAYEVSLEAADGGKVRAIAVCHHDTSEWNPRHISFQVLKVKPGSVPVCHFLIEDHILWVPK